MNLLNLFTLVCVKSNLHLLIGMKLPSLPVSILCSHISVLWVLFVFHFTIITDLMLWILKAFALTVPQSCVAISITYHLGAYCELLCTFLFCHLLTYACPGFCIPTCTLLHLEQLLPYAEQLLGSCVLPQYLQLFHVSFLSLVLFYWFCLWQWILFCFYLPLLVLFGPFIPHVLWPNIHLLTGDFTHLSGCGKLFNYVSHCIIIIYDMYK